MKMRRLLLIVFCFCLTAVSAALPNDNKPDQTWLPVTPQDWQIKEVPYNPGAPAIQLYFSYYKDDNENFVSVYRRIKILTEAGRKYADASIEIEPEQSLQKLMARTVHADGTISEFKGKPFDKIAWKIRGVKRVTKTFAFPDVTVGSIIEYMYTVTLPQHIVDTISDWPIQSELFTVKEHLRFRPYQGVVNVPTEWGAVDHHSRVSYAYVNQVDPKVPEKRPGNLMELELENVPAFRSEDYMPPEDDFKPAVYFFYGGRESITPEAFWTEWRKLYSEYQEKYIGNYGDVRNAASELIRDETDPEKKLRKLYARAQQIRNLTYERWRTQEETKREGLKRNTSASDVLQHGYGNAYDVNRFFVALARAAGFDASPLFVSDRKRRSFNKIILWLGQVNGEATLIKVNGKDLILYPGVRYCPYGLVPWVYTSTAALNVTKTGELFFTTPPPLGSLARRSATITLASDGSARGELKVELTGQEALQHRLDALSTDEAGRRKAFEDEVGSWLPAGSIVKMQSSDGWDATEQPLIAHFNVEVPNFASIAGKRMLAPSFLFATLQKDMFRSMVRTYPVVFSYPFSEQDELTLTLPEGYSLEVAPYRRKTGLSYAGYETESSFTKNELTVKRVLHVDRPKVAIEDYLQLKEFFDVVLKGDEGQAVLSSVSVQKE